MAHFGYTFFSSAAFCQTVQFESTDFSWDQLESLEEVFGWLVVHIGVYCTIGSTVLKQEL